MIGYAAAGDTWGIPGQTFLLIYVGAAIVIFIGALVHRAAAFGGSREASADRLGPQQVAYLNGGDRLAVYTSLGALRSTGAVGSGPGNSLAQCGPLPAGATPLDQAVHHAAGNRVRARALTSDQWVRQALDQIREDLERAGLALTGEQRRTARRGPLLLLLLVPVGLARLLAGLANDKPVGFLILALVLVLAVGLVLLARMPRQTEAARSVLRDLRKRHDHLAPGRSPAYATYGATGVAMGVALFGAASLFALDPAFADEAGLERSVGGFGGLGGSSAGYTGYTGTGTGSSCSSGSSCGGGGGGCGGGGGGCGG